MGRWDLALDVALDGLIDLTTVCAYIASVASKM